MIKGFSSFSIQPCMFPLWTRVLLSRRNEDRCKFTAPADVSTIWIMRYEGSVALCTLRKTLLYLLLACHVECFDSICIPFLNSF
jgi:hypothetical protein